MCVPAALCAKCAKQLYEFAMALATDNRRRLFHYWSRNHAQMFSACPRVVVLIATLVQYAAFV